MMDNLLNFPPTTIFGKRIPKEVFSKQSGKPGLMREWLAAEVESIVFGYKLTTGTLNVAKGEAVSEIDVFIVAMKGDSYTAQRLELIDSLLPRHNIFVVSHSGSIDLVAFYKECQQLGEKEKWTKGKMEILRDVSLLPSPLRIEGLTLDNVYVNLLRTISQTTATSIAEYKQDKARAEEREAIERQIATLTRKMKKAAEPRRKLEIFNEISELKKKL